MGNPKKKNGVWFLVLLRIVRLATAALSCSNLPVNEMTIGINVSVKVDVLISPADILGLRSFSCYRERFRMFCRSSFCKPKDVLSKFIWPWQVGIYLGFLHKISLLLANILNMFPKV